MVYWLRRDARRREAKIWEPWFDLVPQIRNDFRDITADDDPLYYNETASVGLLASAASRAGFLSLSEYTTVKQGAGRGRPRKYGRCDLWVGERDGRRSWAFEFKQIFCRATPREATLAAALEWASKDAKAVQPFEAEYRFGALLIAGQIDGQLSDKAIFRIQQLATTTTFACRFGGGSGPVWLLAQQL